MEENAQQLPPAILLIENDDNDVFLFRRAVAVTKWPGNVRVVGTATEARAYMENLHPYTDRVYYHRPQLIVADYRLAGHTALEFIRWLRGQPELVAIPVILLTGTASGMSPEALAEIRPRAFIQKTGDVEELVQALKPFLPKTGA